MPWLPKYFHLLLGGSKYYHKKWSVVKPTIQRHRMARLTDAIQEIINMNMKNQEALQQLVMFWLLCTCTEYKLYSSKSKHYNIVWGIVVCISNVERLTWCAISSTSNV